MPLDGRPLAEVVAECLRRWDVTSEDESSNEEDDFCGWRVGSRQVEQLDVRLGQGRRSDGKASNEPRRPSAAQRHSWNDSLLLSVFEWARRSWPNAWTKSLSWCPGVSSLDTIGGNQRVG